MKSKIENPTKSFIANANPEIKQDAKRMQKKAIEEKAKKAIEEKEEAKKKEMDSLNASQTSENAIFRKKLHHFIPSEEAKMIQMMGEGKSRKDAEKAIRGQRRAKRDNISFAFSDAIRNKKEGKETLKAKFEEMLSLYYPDALNEAKKGKEAKEILPLISNKLFRDDAFLNAKERGQKNNLIECLNEIKGKKA